MERSIAWLEWLVLGAGYELTLFASVGILLIGLDDLLFDIRWMLTRRRTSRHLYGEAAQFDGCIAIFVPAWQEAPVLPGMLCRTLAAWDGEDFRLYVGCYPNDAATLCAISPLVARDPRLRLVISEGDGPTTKGDNLNRMWAALGEDERADAMRFAAIILHDAEDYVHAEELTLYRRMLVDHAMVQIPVVPFVGSGPDWVGGHYGDEFAEAHGKELALRSALGLPIPSAGVGCALTRSAVALLAIERGGQPFRAESLTEDYEVGMLIGAYGLRACFVDVVGANGDHIVSRGSFPRAVEASVRQKSRWIAGIALAGWDHLGWPGTGRKPAGFIDRHRWLARWMLWRDRRAPLAALVLLAAYAGFLVTALGWGGHALFGWQAPAISEGARLLLSVDVALLMWRLGMRSHFTARWYGWRQAVMALPRAFVANVIAILAARRAVLVYRQMLRSGRVIWDKTEHLESDGAFEPVTARA